MTTTEPQYPEDFIQRLELIWGDGFLSPGGAEEVREIVNGIELEGRAVLDIGCGTGGVEVVLARDLGAGHVTATDIEPQLIDRTRQRMEDEGVTDRVDVRLVEPGPLAFADGTFDIVFSKDSLIHVPDKPAMFGEILRVLRPGGVFAASDWLVGENAGESATWKRFSELGHLSFEVRTADQTARMLEDAGFERVTTRDRNDWYASLAVEETRQLEGPLRARAVELVGAEIYDHWLEVRRALRDAAVSGDLRPTHLRGFRPD